MRKEKADLRVLRFKSALKVGIAFVALSAMGGQVMAQADPEASGSSDAEWGVLSEIVVTARRTEERLEDVPVSVSAFNSEALAERRIYSEFDLQVATPGLLSKQGMSSNYLNYSLRGQSVGAFSYSPPAVVSYFNEVPIGGLSATSFFDLEAIQVLKGPQGTLFGRNTTGGAVLYAAKKPDNEFGGYLKGGYGNYNNVELEGAINIPLSKGIALRVSGRSQTRDGFQHNLLYDTYANSVDSQVGRASLLIAPEDSGFENILTVQRGNYGGQNGALVLANAYGAAGAPTTYIDPATGATVPLNTSLATFHGPDAVGPGLGSSTNPLVNELFNGVEDYLLKRASGEYGGFYDFYSNQHDGDLAHDANQTIVTNITSYEVSDSVTVRNVFGYNRLFSSDFLDIDGSPYDWIAIAGGPDSTVDGKTFPAGGYVFGTEQWSEELQFLGNIGSVEYIVGGFVSDETTFAYSPISIAPDLPGFGYIGAYDAEIDDKSYALYAQATYAATDKLNVTAGVRYTWEKVGISFRESEPGDPALLSGIQPTSAKASDPSWLLSADYQLSDDLMVYFVHRGSWRTGGFNATSAANFPFGDYFEPEKTYDFEAGAKFSGYVGGVPMRLNVAVFDQYVKNVQRTIYIVTPVGPAAVAGNVNKARITGVEIDGSFDVTSWLQLGGAFSYTDARYTDPRALFGGQEFFFGPYSDTPEVTGSAYFRAATSLGDGIGELALRGEIYAQGSWFYSNTDDSASPLTKLESYEIVNMRAEWNDMFGSDVSAAIYAHNLTKTKYYAGGNSNGPSGGFNSIIPGAPRMYGAELTVKY